MTARTVLATVAAPVERLLGALAFSRTTVSAMGALVLAGLAGCSPTPAPIQLATIASTEGLLAPPPAPSAPAVTPAVALQTGKRQVCPDSVTGTYLFDDGRESTRTFLGASPLFPNIPGICQAGVSTSRGYRGLKLSVAGLFSGTPENDPVIPVFGPAIWDVIAGNKETVLFDFKVGADIHKHSFSHLRDVPAVTKQDGKTYSGHEFEFTDKQNGAAEGVYVVDFICTFIDVPAESGAVILFELHNNYHTFSFVHNQSIVLQKLSSSVARSQLPPAGTQPGF